MELTKKTAAEISAIVRLQDQRLDEELVRYKNEGQSGKKIRVQAQELGRAALMLPLYCHPESRYYRDRELLGILEEVTRDFLATQLPSGCVSLYNCNIDSPPDTAFTSHLVATLVQMAQKHADPEAANVIDTLLLFMERAQPCMLKGGIHTPNHRWVHASSLAKMEELFGGGEFRVRAFQFLNEGLDITEYGEWTERSNAIYNAICAYYLYTVGKTFGYKPAYDAAGSTLKMMRYLLHPGDKLATEYSGRQDLGQIVAMDDRYYVAYHLLAVHEGDPALAAMAQIARRTAPRGSLALMHWMLEPEAMMIPDEEQTIDEHYTVLLGEGNQVPVPDRVPFLGPVTKHPHGAAVLRHRQGKLSVTVMAGQPELLYVQYGEARMFGMKLGVGWFGIGAAAFPGISRFGSDAYRMEIELEGYYFEPLPEELTRDAKGIYVHMPNHLREVSSTVKLKLAMEFRFVEDGLDMRILSDDEAGIFLQPVFMFDKEGELAGEGLEATGPSMQRLSHGEAEFRRGSDCIRIGDGDVEHGELYMRNDSINPGASNMMINLVTPIDRIIRIRCSHSAEQGSEEVTNVVPQ